MHYTNAPPPRRTSQHPRTFIPLSVSLWIDLADHVFDCMGLSELGSMLFFWPKLLVPFLSSTVFPFSSFYWLELWGWGLWTDGIGCKSLSLSLALPTSFNNKNNNNEELPFYMGTFFVCGNKTDSSLLNLNVCVPDG